MSEIYIWRITDPSTIRALKKDKIQSPSFKLYGFKWYFVFYGNDSYGGNLYLYLAVLPSNIRKIQTRIILSIAEIDVEKSYSKYFSRSEDYVGGEMLKCSELQKSHLSQFTVKLSLDVLKVDDRKRGDITDEYEQKSNANYASQSSLITETMQLYEARLNSMETQMELMMKNIAIIQNSLEMNEEKKENSGYLQKQVDEINKKINILLSNNNEYNYNNENKDKIEFKNWIVKILKLPEYYDLFVENGVESLNVIRLFTMNELTMMGITKIGHKMQILHAIMDLKQEGAKSYTYE